MAESQRQDRDPTGAETLPEPGLASDALTARGLVPHGSDRFEKRELLGKGGMGEVHLAFDRELRREVAVKTLRVAAPSEHWLRFVEEAQITGQLQHPSIVPVHELLVDPETKRPSLVMKSIKGKSLREVLDLLAGGTDSREVFQNPKIDGPTRTLARLLEFFVKVCDAVGYAHSRGVIHRDLKPANVMTGKFGEVLVMDWGLAKILARPESGPPESTGPRRSRDRRTSPLATFRTNNRTDGALTLPGRVPGTPLYMCPEQARGELDAMDVRSDIYSLGAILYEIVTLVRPVDATSVLDILYKVGKGEIDPPEKRSLSPWGVPRELGAVITKAMSFAPEERYASASDLKEEVLAFLEGRPLAAAHYSILDLARRWVGRHRIAVLGAALGSAGALAALFLAVIGIDSARRREATERIHAESERDRADLERDRAQDERTRAETELDRATRRLSDALVALSDFHRTRRTLGAALLYATAARAISDTPRTAAVRFALPVPRTRLERVIEPTQGDPAPKGLALSPDGSLLAVATDDSIRLHALAATGPPRVLDSAEQGLRVIEFSPVGRFLATGGENGVLRIWDSSTGRVTREWQLGAGSVASASFSSDGAVVAVGSSDGRIRAVRWNEGEIVFAADFDWKPFIGFVSFSADGRRLAAGTERVAHVFDLETGTRLLVESGGSSKVFSAEHEHSVRGAAFSRDGGRLLTAGVDKKVRVWDLASSREVQSFDDAAGASATASSIGRAAYFATGGEDGTIRIWDLREPGLFEAVGGAFGKIDFVALSSSGEFLAAASRGQAIRVWRVLAAKEFRQDIPRLGAIRSSALSERGDLLAAGGYYGEIDLIDLSTGKVIRSLICPSPLQVLALAFVPGTDRLASAGKDGTLRLWSTSDGRSTVVYNESGAQFQALAASPDGNMLAAGDDQGYLRFLGTTPGSPTRESIRFGVAVTSLVFDPTNGMLAVGTADGTVRLLDPSTRQVQFEFPASMGAIRALAFHPRLPYLAAAPSDSTVQIWDLRTHEIRVHLTGHTSTVTQAVFSPDGRLIATSGHDDRTIRIWDAASGEFLRLLEGHLYSITGLAFSPDGRVLVSTSSDQSFRIWGLDAPESVVDAEGSTGMRIDDLELVPSGAALPGERPLRGATDPWPLDSQDAFYRGAMFLFENNRAPADRALGLAHRIDPTTWKELVRCAQYLDARLGRPDAAIRFMKKALEFVPGEEERRAVEREIEILQRGR